MKRLREISRRLNDGLVRLVLFLTYTVVVGFAASVKYVWFLPHRSAVQTSSWREPKNETFDKNRYSSPY